MEGIVRLMQAQGGMASSRQLVDAGFSRSEVRRLVRQGVIQRIRRGVLVLSSALEGLSAWERQGLIVRAVGLELAATPESKLALSHESALAIHGLPYYGEDGSVHLVRTDGARGHREGLVHVHGPVDPGRTSVVEGLRVVDPVVAALQVAAAHGAEAGVVALDGVLHRARQQDAAAGGSDLGTALAEAGQQIEAVLDGYTRVPAAVRRAVELADGRSESAGESRSRWLVLSLGLGGCTPQFAVWDDDVLVARADLKLDRWRVLLEFDGGLKYTDPAVLRAEKDREDRLRRLGYEVVRIRWSDLAHPEVLRRRIFDAIERAQARAALDAMRERNPTRV